MINIFFYDKILICGYYGKKEHFAGDDHIIWQHLQQQQVQRQSFQQLLCFLS